jgi:hypothetical protein
MGVGQLMEGIGRDIWRKSSGFWWQVYPGFLDLAGLP